jgi:hypothetical protein
LPVIRGIRYGGFRRGFIDDVDVGDAEAFVRIAQLVFDRVPVRRLAIGGLTAALRERLLAVDGIAYVRLE